MNDHPLARRTDPGTSHEAAEGVRPELTSLQARALAMVAAYPDRTATELAEQAGDRDPRRINRRLTELVRDGRIVVTGSRPCRITGRTAQTYRIPTPPPPPVDPTQQMTLF